MNPPSITITDNKLTIIVDLSKDEGRSKKGRSTIVSSTHGFLTIPNRSDGLAIGMNVVRNKEK
jgi:hypothetical protein